MLNLHMYTGGGKKKEAFRNNLNKLMLAEANRRAVIEIEKERDKKFKTNESLILGFELSGLGSNLYLNTHPKESLKHVKKFINDKNNTHHIVTFDPVIYKLLEVSYVGNKNFTIYIDGIDKGNSLKAIEKALYITTEMFSKLYYKGIGNSISFKKGK